MIKGWRNNPQWVAVVEQRTAAKEAARQIAKMASNHAEAIAAQYAHMEAEARHREQCHAEHEAAGIRKETMN